MNGIVYLVDKRSREEIIKEAMAYAKTTNDSLFKTNYYIDMDLVKKVVSFITLLKHTGGELGGVQFQLLPFQIKFLIDVICTLNKVNNRRRYTTALLFLPRKSGKTELIAALLNYFLFVDSEKGKEIYCAANETDQAKIIFKATETMIKQEPRLETKCDIYKSTRTIEKSGEFEDFIKVLTANADTKDGLKPYITVYDELHAAKSADLYTVLEEGMAHRTQPLFIIISTAGYNHHGIMKQKYEYAKKVKKELIQDDSFYSMIYEPDDEDDWKEESTWIKCNPALGYGVKIEYLRNKFIKALHSGDDEVAFKTKHLNMWTNAATVWIKDEVWRQSATKVNEDDLIGKPCYCGLDLASTTDIAAFVLLFPKEDGKFDVLCRFFIPEDSMRERARKDRVPYITWVRDGYITATSGNIIDYNYIEKQIKEDCEKFNIEVIAYDSWNSSQLIVNLSENDINLSKFRQGFGSMSAPTKQIETLVLQNKLNHGNNPVLNWMCSNVSIQKDASDNIKIDKAKSSEKVDGMVALAMALGIYLTDGKKENEYYDGSGILFM